LQKKYYLLTKKSIINARRVEIFFAKLCTNLARCVGGLSLFKVLLLSSISYLPYYTRDDKKFKKLFV
jgi:hypothetical protein